MSVKLNLMVIYVADLEASKRFYESIGLRFAKERHGSGPEHYSADLEGVIIELYPLSPRANQKNQSRVGFSVQNVDDVVAGCQSSGGRLITAVKDSPWGRRAVVEDPDGHKIELLEDTAGSG